MTDQQVADLVGAMGQVLDDMGMAGTSVSEYTKAKARIAIEPFMNFLDADVEEVYMSLDEAVSLVRYVDNRR